MSLHHDLMPSKATTYVLLVLVTIGIFGSTAAAKPHEKERALELFEEAKRDYNRGDFEKAATTLKTAYGLYPEPILLYNLARSLESLGDLEGARDAYRSYLREGEAISDRRAIERRVEALEEQIREKARAEAAERRAKQLQDRLARGRESRQVTPKSKGASAWPWVVVGTGLVTVSAGGIYGWTAHTRSQEANEEPIQQIAADKHREAEELAKTATILYVAGSAVTTAGLLWWLYERSSRTSEKSAPATAWRLHFDSQHVLVGWTF